MLSLMQTKNTNLSNNFPDIELDYNDLFCMLIDYYYDPMSINNLLCLKNKSSHLFMIYFNVKSVQKNIDKISHYLTD